MRRFRFVALLLALIATMGMLNGCIIVAKDGTCKTCRHRHDWCGHCDRKVGPGHECKKTHWCDQCHKEVGPDHKCG